MSRKRSPGKSARLDETDLQILRLLQENSKITNAMLAERVGISPPTMLERVKKLEAHGVIRGYVALLDPEPLGKGVIAIVHISLREHTAKTLATMKTRLSELDEVLSCWYCAGDEDFILKVVVGDMREYEHFISRKVSSVPGIGKIKTSFVLDAVKETTRLPIAEEEDEPADD